METVLLKTDDIKPPLNITVVTSVDQFPELEDFLINCGPVVGWDIETTPLKDYYNRRTRTVQFGTKEKQFVVDLLALCDGNSNLLFEAQGKYGANLDIAPNLKKFIDVIKPFLTIQSLIKVGVVLSFEYMNFYWQFGLRTCGFFDCSLVERVIYAGLHSLKHYEFYSMESMIRRYFGFQIEKILQTSFNLVDPLTEDQIKYAALDTRFLLALRDIQTLILKGRTVKDMLVKQSPHLTIFSNLNPLILGDNLTEIAQIENDAIGAFQDFHVHGERINREKWLHRCEELEAELHNLIVGTLDPIFIPIVGNKKETITDEMIEKATSEWKAFTEVSGEELAYIKNERAAKKLGDSEEAERFTKLTDKARLDRLAEKERLKIEARKLSYLQTTQRNLTAECEGDALINYGSDKQLVAVIKKMPGLASVNDMQDGTLEKYKNKPVMAAIKEYHRLSKEISTYGRAWATVWKTHPCNEEGWLNPGDERLHSTFNQLEAETGRSSSEKPNGQNVPRDKDIRSCFIADEPNPDEMVLITIDMSGAELRIIAECANDPLWIGAFARNEDVHSVGTELLYPEEWISGALPNCAYYKLHTEESVEKNPLCKIGEPQRQKCECPKHKTMRSDNKDCNFLIAYGGSSYALAARIGKKAREAALLMALHEQKNPLIWSYLNKSGIDAKRRKKSFDMFGRRRLFPEPTRELARERFIDDFSEKLLRPLYTKKDQTGATIEGSIEMQERFENQFHRKPTPKERWHLTHVSPTEKQITSTMIRMCDEISRQGKNHCIQGTNVSIAKLALGSSQDENGNPYLWTTLPKYGAKMVKFVHDELVISCPKKYSEIVANLVVDAFRRAAFKKMKNVVMESDYVISDHWEK